MISQKTQFLDGEADRWFERNSTHLLSPANWQKDPVLVLLNDLEIRSGLTLELGCATGYRLAALDRRDYGKRTGIDPSRQAIEQGKALFPELDLTIGACDAIPLNDGAVDLLIFGYCLYLNEFDALFEIASEAHRVLAPGGTVIIYDFFAEQPYRNPYGHGHGMFSHKMDFRRMFLWNPLYAELSHIIFQHGDVRRLPDGPNDACIVSAIRKT